MITKTLTGATRHRAVNLMFKPTMLVLQVQEHLIGFEIDPDGDTNKVDCMFWRDATTEDVTMIGVVING